jgi:hypothetical protein
MEWQLVKSGRAIRTGKELKIKRQTAYTGKGYTRDYRTDNRLVIRHRNCTYVYTSSWRKQERIYIAVRYASCQAHFFVLVSFLGMVSYIDVLRWNVCPIGLCSQDSQGFREKQPVTVNVHVISALQTGVKGDTAHNKEPQSSPVTATTERAVFIGQIPPLTVPSTAPLWSVS